MLPTRKNVLNLRQNSHHVLTFGNTLNICKSCDTKQDLNITALLADTACCDDELAACCAKEGRAAAVLLAVALGKFLGVFVLVCIAGLIGAVHCACCVTRLA